MGTGASTVPANPRAVLICHSSQEQTLRQRLVRLLGDRADADVAIVTERYPRETHARAAVLASVGVAVLALDAAFQCAPRLVETVSFLKDTRRSVLAGPLTFHVRPSGAVGAICFALGTWEPALFCCGDGDDECAQARERVRSAGLEFLTTTEVERVITEAAAEAEAASETHSEVEIDSPVTPLSDADSTQDDRGSNSDTARVLIVYAGTDGECVASAFGALNYASTPGTVVEQCACDAVPLAQSVRLLAHSRVAVFVITAASMQDAHYRVLFDTAVRWRVSILPIHAAAGVRMPGWLAMCMAGKLWYQVALDALEQIYTPYAELPNCPCKVHDACLAADFLQCLSGLLLAPTESRRATTSACEETLDRDLAGREAALIQLCREQAIVAGGLGHDTVDDICARVSELVAVCSSSGSESDASGSRAHAREQLEALGVAMDVTAVAAQMLEDERAIRAVTPRGEDLLPAPVTDTATHLPLTMTHYQVTRTGVSAPVPRVLDAYGVPLRNLALDAMFSYQWGAQDRVLDIHQQGQVHHLRAWFDVYGHMQGNVNAAMATAVESVACVVVFLTRAYVQSVNCRLEFQYARACGKPMIFAFLDDPHTLVPELPDWVTDTAGGSDKLSVHPSIVVADDDTPPTAASCVLALDLTCDSLRGVAMNAVLLSAIRQLAAARHRSEPRVVYDSSLLLYATTRALRFAVTSAATTPLESTRASTSTTCTRCGAAFAPDVASTLDGCRKHAAYYMGGSILAGRWVCCQEPRKDGAGCELTQHTADARKWTEDPDYGTHSWVPA